MTEASPSYTTPEVPEKITANLNSIKFRLELIVNTNPELAPDALAVFERFGDILKLLNAAAKAASDAAGGS